MNLSADTLDTTFGPIRFGVWPERSPYAYRTICVDGRVYNVNPYWLTCAGCVRLDPVDDSCGTICSEFRPDSAESNFEPASGLCEVDSAALGSSPAKMTERSRKLVIAFYQAFFERLLVSRMMSKEPNDEQLYPIVAGNGMSYEVSPLNYFVDSWICGLPDPFYCGYKTYPLLCADNRKRAGALRGKISDGIVARGAMAAVNSFIKKSKARYDADQQVNKLYPPTPTRYPGGRLPVFGGGVFVTDAWIDGDRLWSQYWTSGCTDRKIDELKTKVLPAFGASGFGDYHTDSWLVDMTMRKLAAQAGLGPHDARDLAPFFRDLLEAINLNGLDGIDARTICGIVGAFASKQTRTDRGDPSGDFAATCDDFCNGVDMADRLKCHNTTLETEKTSAVGLGYAATILGSFGQNAVNFGFPDLRHRFRENVVTGSKHVDYIPSFGVFNGHCYVNHPSGYNPMTETLDWLFYACGVSETAHFRTRCSCTIGVGARVSGYGGALPWFGGDVILYPGPDALEDCVWCGLECRCVSIDELLRASCGCEGHPTTYCDYYWRLRHELPYNRGFSDASFCFSWTCNRCGLPVMVDCLCDKYDRAYHTRYPARSVLQSKLIELVKDVHVYFTVLDAATKLTTCFRTVNQSGFHEDALSPSDLREFIEKCADVHNCTDAPLHYLDNLFRKFLSMADAYVKSESQLRIRSTGYAQMRSSRRMGCTIDCVIHPKSFPITRADLFEGKKALIDPRGEDELTDEINKDCNIFTCGYWPEAVNFGRRGEVTGVIVRDVKTGSRAYLGNVQLVSFQCHNFGRTYYGWKVGRLQRTGNHGVWRCKYEPYALAVEHEIAPGAAFGVVRWDFKMLKRV